VKWRRMRLIDHPACAVACFRRIQEWPSATKRSCVTDIWQRFFFAVSIFRIYSFFKSPKPIRIGADLTTRCTEKYKYLKYVFKINMYFIFCIWNTFWKCILYLKYILLYLYVIFKQQCKILIPQSSLPWHQLSGCSVLQDRWWFLVKMDCQMDHLRNLLLRQNNLLKFVEH